jgi:hypothetical protein
VNIFLRRPICSFTTNRFYKMAALGTGSSYVTRLPGPTPSPLHSADSQTDPRGPEAGSDGGDRVLRGGSFNDDAFHMRCAVRKKEFPGVAYGDYGFRCVRKE